MSSESSAESRASFTYYSIAPARSNIIKFNHTEGNRTNERCYNTRRILEKQMTWFNNSSFNILHEQRFPQWIYLKLYEQRRAVEIIYKLLRRKKLSELI